MVELYRATDEDESDESGKSKKRVDPDKLAKFHFAKPPSAEKPPSEFLPPPPEIGGLVDSSEKDGPKDQKDEVPPTGEARELSEDFIHLRASRPPEKPAQPAEEKQEAPEPPKLMDIPLMETKSQPPSRKQEEAPRPPAEAEPPAPEPPRPAAEPRPEPFNPPRPAERPPQPAAETGTNSAEEERKRNMRMVIVAGVATGLLLKAYLDRKAAERAEAVSRAPSERAGAAGNRYLEKDVLPGQAQAERAAAAVFGAEAPEAQDQLFDSEGNRIILQPGWRVERSAGGYSVVLDEHGRVVHDAIHYGDEYKRDQKREHLSEDILALFNDGSSQPAGEPSSVPAEPPVSAPGSQPGQSVSQHTPPLSLKGAAVDLKHRLPKPHKHMLSATIANPWLWTGTAILIIIYFLAALA